MTRYDMRSMVDGV